MTSFALRHAPLDTGDTSLEHIHHLMAQGIGRFLCGLTLLLQFVGAEYSLYIESQQVYPLLVISSPASTVGSV